MDTPLATVEHGTCKAEIYETALPGQFSIRYYDAVGTMVAEEELTGVSTYKQREKEIMERIQQICEGVTPDPAELSDPGEY